MLDSALGQPPSLVRAKLRAWTHDASATSAVLGERPWMSSESVAVVGIHDFSSKRICGDVFDDESVSLPTRGRDAVRRLARMTAAVMRELRADRLRQALGRRPRKSAGGREGH